MFKALLYFALVFTRALAVTDATIIPECTGECAENYEISYKFENASWVAENLSDDRFWSIPDNTTATAAGDILRWEYVTPDANQTKWTIPGGTTLARFLYLTQDINGTLLPASAFALLPYRPLRGEKKLRTLVWAHGTAGFAPKCGPSNHNNLFYDWSAPYSFAQAGYAVIAPDYTGLGTTIPQGFMYLAGYSHAADVAFSLIAARQQLGDILTDEWVTVGQSEGGMTAWRTNQRLAMDGQESLLKAGRFLGSVAIAPAMRPVDMLADATASGDIANYAGVNVYLLQSLAGLYPDLIRLEDIFTPTALERAKLSLESCIYTAYYLFTGLNVTETYKDESWFQYPAVTDWRKSYMKEGTSAFAAPMLIVQGTADILVPVNYTQAEYTQMCTDNPESSIQLLLYNGLDHDTVTNTAQPDYLSWVADRFNGIQAQQNCSQNEFSPLFDTFNIVATVYKANEL